MDAVAHAETVGSTGSRLLSGNSREWEELEAEFAAFRGHRSGALFRFGVRSECRTARLRAADMATLFSPTR